METLAEFQTESGLLRIRRAQAGERATVLSLLEEAERWLAAKPDRGADQWPVGFHAENRTRWAPALERGEVFFAIDGDEPVAMCIVNRDGWSERLWGEQSQEALFLSKVTVRRAWAGKGIPARLVAWAETRAQREGAKWMGLDCLQALVPYYGNLGYTHVGQRQVGPYAIQLMKKPLDVDSLTV